MSFTCVLTHFSGLMALFDVWTPLFAAAVLANVVLVVLNGRRKKDHDDIDSSAPAPATA